MAFKTLQRSFFFTLLTLITVAFIWTIHAYLFPLFWAAVLTIIFYPLHRGWLKLTEEKDVLSTLLTLLSVVVIVLVPLFFLGNAVIQESLQFYQRINSDPNFFQNNFDSLNKAVPVTEWLDDLGLDDDAIKAKVGEFAQTATRFVFNSVVQFGQSTLRFLVNLFVMFFLLYVFLKRGPELAQKLTNILPLGDQKERRLFRKFASTARATVKGTFLIGIIQGLLGGVLFWAVGIDAPVLWGAVMAVLSIIPAVGPALIWAPAGIILIITGSVVEGIIVLIAGAAVIGTIDNILRPPLIGRDTQMPEALILLSTLGGLSVFGISGFVIGPIVAAFFLAVWEMFEEEYHKELTAEG